ncbi:hypothetical protein Vretifemale_12774, partial [Volvox reticuliferus]
FVVDHAQQYHVAMRKSLVSLDCDKPTESKSKTKAITLSTKEWQEYQELKAWQASSNTTTRAPKSTTVGTSSQPAPQRATQPPEGRTRGAQGGRREDGQRRSTDGLPCTYAKCLGRRAAHSETECWTKQLDEGRVNNQAPPPAYFVEKHKQARAARGKTMLTVTEEEEDEEATTLAITKADLLRWKLQEQEALAPSKVGCPVTTSPEATPATDEDASVANAWTNRERLPAGFEQLPPGPLPSTLPRSSSAATTLDCQWRDGRRVQLQLGPQAPAEALQELLRLVKEVVKEAPACDKVSARAISTKADPAAPLITAGVLEGAPEELVRQACADYRAAAEGILRMSNQAQDASVAIVVADGSPLWKDLHVVPDTASDVVLLVESLVEQAGLQLAPTRILLNTGHGLAGTGPRPLGQVEGGLTICLAPGTPHESYIHTNAVVVPDATAQACGFSVLLGTRVLHRGSMEVRRFPSPHLAYRPRMDELRWAYLPMEPLVDKAAAHLNAVRQCLVTGSTMENSEGAAAAPGPAERVEPGPIGASTAAALFPERSPPGPQPLSRAALPTRLARAPTSQATTPASQMAAPMTSTPAPPPAAAARRHYQGDLPWAWAMEALGLPTATWHPDLLAPLNASLLILQLQEQGLFTAAEATQAAHQRLVQVLEQSAIGQEFLRASLAASTPGLLGYTGPLPLAGNLRVLELRSATHPGEEEAVRRTLSNEGFLHADDVQAKAFALSTLCLSRGPNITPADADVAGEGVTTHPTGGSGLAPPVPTTLMTPPQPTRRVSTREALVSRPPPTEERQPLATSGRRSRSRERPPRS